MGNNDLAKRFTENYYATKNEVSKELKISVIDGVWDKILSYRSLFYQYLNIKGIDKNQLRICLCPTVSSKGVNIESKMNRLLNEYLKLDRINGDQKYYEQSNLIKCLQNIGAKKNLVSDEETVKGIIHGSRSVSELANYLDALLLVKKNYENEIDIDYLADLFSAVTGNPELTYFYRDSDNEDINSSAVISRRYNSAPHQIIEQMMEGLFNFINRFKLNGLYKALITYYYVEFVKPFKNYNDEIAVLLAKTVIAKETVGEFAIYMPFESLINENSNEVNKLFNEVQATSDLTYFLSFALDSTDRMVERMLDSLAEYNTQIIKNDFYQLDEEKAEEPVEEIVKEEAPVIQEQPQVKQPEPQPQIVKEVIREIIREVPVPTPAKEVEEKKEAVKPEPIKDEPRGLAVSYIPPEIDEKTALRLERHLLELDVRLKKGQAYFYARHCTLGMYYTIEQYRRAVKCVYETARTSMDKLAEFGYYEKKQIGKKFVYTPVERK